jgi:hypothetical protein
VEKGSRSEQRAVGDMVKAIWQYGKNDTGGAENI